MLNHSQEAPQPPPQFITMKDAYGAIVEIPIEQANIVAIFKSIGYREVQMAESEVNDVATDQ